jgi:hypothetical protein
VDSGQLPASLDADGGLKVHVQNTLPVTGTFFQATQPVSGPLTDTQLRSSAVPVSGTFFQATQPVSIAAVLPISDNNGSANRRWNSHRYPANPYQRYAGSNRI